MCYVDQDSQNTGGTLQVLDAVKQILRAIGLKFSQSIDDWTARIHCAWTELCKTVNDIEENHQQLVREFNGHPL